MWSPTDAGSPLPATDGVFRPDGHPPHQRRRKEKISKGDAVGYITAHTDLKGSDIGLITVNDHSTLIAVPDRPPTPS